MTRLLALALAGLSLAPSAAGAELPLGPRDLPERRSSTRLDDGVTWTRIARGESTRRPGPWVVNVLEVERAALPGASISSLLSNGRIAGRETVSAMARRAGALAGVNGGYFVVAGPGEGDVAGVVLAAGQVLSEPIAGRAALLVPRSPVAAPEVTELDFRGSVELGARTRLLDGVERVPGIIPSCGGRGGDRPTERPYHGLYCTDPSELVYLSRTFARRTPPGGRRVEAVVRGGVVTATRRRGGTAIPADGYVLVATGPAAGFLRSRATPGARPAVSTGLHGPRGPLLLGDYDAIVSAGPRLLRAGRVAVRSAAEGFRPPGNPALHQRFVLARHPRTLAGVTADGRLLLVTVDGRRPGYSAGVTLPEAARLMRSLGSRDALNLDGGGSTTMAVRGRAVNRPSDPTGERPVGNGLFVAP